MEVVTLDGPAGAGKSTVSREVARRLGYTYLDTGAMYRAVGWAASEAGIPFDDEPALRTFCEGLDLRFDGECILVNGRDVSALIRTPEVDALSSAISKVGAVREVLGRIQRQLGAKGRVVAEGRDMGTVVFPEAEHKFFLTASVEDRAMRRKKQLEEKGSNVVYGIILQQIVSRDEADSSRALAPLKPASDAVVIDSSRLTVEDVVSEIVRQVSKKK